jgi:hypothetical protein
MLIKESIKQPYALFLSNEAITVRAHVFHTGPLAGRPVDPGGPAIGYLFSIVLRSVLQLFVASR